MDRFTDSYHGHVNVAGIELQVDLLVYLSLAVRMVVLATRIRHFESNFSR